MKLLYADSDGVLYEDPELGAAAWTGAETVPFPEQEAVPLPPGSDLVLLPERAPVGWAAGRPVKDVRRLQGGGKLFAVAAVLPAGFTRTLLPAYRVYGRPPDLGLFGYTAVGARNGEFFAAAVHTDEEYRWNPLLYNDLTLPRRIKAKRRQFPKNRLVEHLAHCACAYHCLTAQNIFYARWEAGLPVSPACNADCLGCISRPPSGWCPPAGCCPAPQERIGFVPTVAEVVELGTSHLQDGVEPIISFGQGCEGEPLLQAQLLVAAVRGIRKATGRGTINLNTNGGDPAALAALGEAGLDSVRISLISAREETYLAYHRPRGFNLADVRRSLAAARARGVFVSLNLLVLPGLTDREEEVKALLELLQSEKVHMVQLRNLSADPYRLLTNLPPARGGILGVGHLIARLREIPGLRVGNFTIGSPKRY
ncbi:radical SAM protein [Candidatus Desulforudis audaxviator]|uniref:radical SAM protein n=2 Tax=Thermoanaerobacterales TaxID=68295 RepID=UPI00107A76B4|nr:radical SAM protein [Candidatus Desulforudis audaxviator]AZK60741.1 Radical SAM domain protein [Candidatus Desulforudis audaxviator]